MGESLVQYCVILTEGQDKDLPRWVWMTSGEARSVYDSIRIKRIYGNDVKMESKYSLVVRCKNEEDANLFAEKFNLPKPFYFDSRRNYILLPFGERKL